MGFYEIETYLLSELKFIENEILLQPGFMRL